MKYCFILLLLATINHPYVRAKEEFEIPFTEDLMHEHGILNRVLLVYEEIIKRIENDSDFPIDTLVDAVDIIKSFIQDHHEKLEETYVFPLFEKQKKEIRLVKTLRNQHKKGGKITAKLQTLVANNNLDDATKKTISYLLKKYIRMYRPHEAREDTVLFPQVRSLMSKKEFKELSETFEELEHGLFGEDGCETMVKKVEAIEKELGIYQLEQFTPNI